MIQPQDFHQYLWKQICKAVSALCALVITFLAGFFWDHLIKPFIQNSFGTLLWKGTRLADTYSTEFVYNGKTYYDLIEVKQRAGRVTGIITSPQSISGKHRFQAELVNNVLRGTFEGEHKNSPASGAFVLVLKAGSRDLNGWCIEPVEGSVIAYEYSWHRKT